MNDPFEDLGSDDAEAPDPFDLSPRVRNLPTVRPRVPRERPRSVQDFERRIVTRGGAQGTLLAWCCIGAPHSPAFADAVLWRAFVTHIGDAFESVLNLPVYRFTEVGKPVRGTRGKEKWTGPAVRRLVLAKYGHRLRVSARLFGVVGHSTLPRWYVPREVRSAYDLGEIAFREPFRGGGAGPSQPVTALARQYGIEAAHFAFVHGFPGLDALRAAYDLEGRKGLRTVLDTWWRY